MEAGTDEHAELQNAVKFPPQVPSDSKHQYAGYEFDESAEESLAEATKMASVGNRHWTLSVRMQRVRWTAATGAPQASQQLTKRDVQVQRIPKQRRWGQLLWQPVASGRKRSAHQAHVSSGRVRTCFAGPPHGSSRCHCLHRWTAANAGPGRFRSPCLQRFQAQCGDQTMSD